MPTSSWQRGDDAAASLIEGALTEDADGCLVVAGSALVWPAGYTAVDTGSSVIVLNERGEEAARTGQKVSLGGGRSIGKLFDGPCAGKDSFSVMDELP